MLLYQKNWCRTLNNEEVIVVQTVGFYLTLQDKIIKNILLMRILISKKLLNEEIEIGYAFAPCEDITRLRMDKKRKPKTVLYTLVAKSFDDGHTEVGLKFEEQEIIWKHNFNYFTLTEIIENLCEDYIFNPAKMHPVFMKKNIPESFIHFLGRSGDVSYWLNGIRRKNEKIIFYNASIEDTKAYERNLNIALHKTRVVASILLRIVANKNFNYRLEDKTKYFEFSYLASQKSIYVYYIDNIDSHHYQEIIPILEFTPQELEKREIPFWYIKVPHKIVRNITR